jgi:hypothetical protein
VLTLLALTADFPHGGWGGSTVPVWVPSALAVALKIEKSSDLLGDLPVFDLRGELMKADMVRAKASNRISLNESAQTVLCDSQTAIRAVFSYVPVPALEGPTAMPFEELRVVGKRGLSVQVIS